MKENFEYLPEELPVPIDDGACDHLIGLQMPDLKLKTTNGEFFFLKSLTGKLVVYLYPMTGPLETPLPKGWDEIPGARGCTPQACSFKNHYNELKELGATVFGIVHNRQNFKRKKRNGFIYLLIY